MVRAANSDFYDTSLYTEKTPEASSEHRNTKQFTVRKIHAQKSPLTMVYIITAPPTNCYLRSCSVCADN